MIKPYFLLLALVVLRCASPPSEQTKPDNSLSFGCQFCHTIVGGIQHSPREPLLRALEIISTQYCIHKKLQIKHVCKGAVKEMTRYILESAWDHALDPHSVCHKIKLCPQEYKLLTLSDYTTRVMKGYVPKQQEPPTKKKILNIMHISDIHPDLFYSEGSPANCNEPVCCRDNVTAKANSTKAGRWGSLSNCDLPLKTFNLFLEQVSKMPLDLVLWTGDNTAHDIWQQTQDYNLNFSVLLTDLMKAKLKAKVIPSAGNHESAPVNVYDFQGKRQNFLNDGLATIWEDWIGKEGSDMYRKNGFYSIYLKDLNLKVISLNTQAGNDENWFLLRNPTDPGGQLAWLEQELAEAEKNTKFVYIVGHIPPKSNLNDWGARYNVLVNRYAYIIRGQYYGHAHEQHIQFFTPLNGSKEIINTCLISSSLTTYSNKNPQFRILRVDADTLRLVDYDQYILKLETKLPEIPSFEHFYSLLNVYQLPDFSFETQLKYRQRLRDDVETQKLFTFLQHSGLGQGHADKGLYCDTMATGTLEAACRGSTSKPSLFDKVAGPWKQLQHQ